MINFALSVQDEGFCTLDAEVEEAVRDVGGNFPSSSNHLDIELDLVFKGFEQTRNTSSSDVLQCAQPDSSTNYDHDQICSDLAYQHVLDEFGLPPGAKLHESTKLVRTWQTQFQILRGKTEN